MHLFSETFLTFFIYASLCLTGLGGLILLGLIIRDWKNKQLW